MEGQVGMIDSVSDSAGAADDLKRRKRASRADANSIDRLPPHSPEAEMGVLGCAMLSPVECMGELVNKIKTSEIFYDLRHAMIYDTMLKMYEINEPLDVITLQQRLKNDNVLEQVGGIAYLAQLQDSVPSAANLSYYLDHVQEKHLLRRMIATCTDVVGRIYDYEGDVAGLIDEVEKEILSIRPDEQEGMKPIKELVQESVQRIEDAFKRQSVVTGMTTGFHDLDHLLTGLKGSTMNVIAARPSMGKTSLGMNIAEHVVIELGQPVGFFSLEMSAAELIDRSICSLGRVNIRVLNEGLMQESSFPRLVSAAGKLSKSKLYIDDTAGLTILQFRARLRRMVQKYGIKLVVVDYLQLLCCLTRRAQDNRQQEISDISKGIKAVAKELKIPILVLAQLNREIEKGSWRKPRMSDLRESGAIEQDADTIGFLYKPKGTEQEDEDGSVIQEETIPVNLLLAKHRNGQVGEVKLTFLRGYTRFESAARISDADVPNHH